MQDARRLFSSVWVFGFVGDIGFGLVCLVFGVCVFFSLDFASSLVVSVSSFLLVCLVVLLGLVLYSCFPVVLWLVCFLSPLLPFAWYASNGPASAMLVEGEGW